MFGARFDGGGADARDIKAHVVIGFGELDRDGTPVFAGEFAPSFQAGVGAFKSLDCKHGAPFHDHGLTDFQTGHLARDAQTEPGIFEGFGIERRTDGEPFRRHVRLEPGDGGNEVDAGGFEFVGDGPEKAVGVAFFDAHEDF